MKRAQIGSLLVLNIALVVVLGILSFTPQKSNAQIGQRSSYLMISGLSRGQQASTIYLADLNNAGLMAVRFNPGAKSLDVVGYRNLKNDFAAGGGR